MESLMDLTANNDQAFQVIMELANQTVPPNDSSDTSINNVNRKQKHALIVLVSGMLEIIVMGGGASGAAAMLPDILFKVYIILFLVLLLLDLILLLVVIMLYYKTQQQPANYVAKFAWRAGLILVILAPMLALATKAYVALA